MFIYGISTKACLESDLRAEQDHHFGATLPRYPVNGCCGMAERPCCLAGHQQLYALLCSATHCLRIGHKSARPSQTYPKESVSIPKPFPRVGPLLGQLICRSLISLLSPSLATLSPLFESFVRMCIVVINLDHAV